MAVLSAMLLVEKKAGLKAKKTVDTLDYAMVGEMVNL